MEHGASLVGRMLAELDSDSAVAALRRHAAAGTETEFRSLRGAWVAAVLRALRRAAGERARRTTIAAWRRRPARGVA